MTISPDGRVTAATADKSELGGDVGACIAHAARGWHFPAVDDGGITVVGKGVRVTP